MLIPKKENNHWIVVYDPNVDFYRKRGLAGKRARNIDFESEEDALAYIDKFADLEGGII